MLRLESASVVTSAPSMASSTASSASSTASQSSSSGGGHGSSSTSRSWAVLPAHSACAHLPRQGTMEHSDLLQTRLSAIHQWQRRHKSKLVHCMECQMPVSRVRMCISCAGQLCAREACHRAHGKKTKHCLSFEPEGKIISCAACRDVVAFTTHPKQNHTVKPWPTKPRGILNLGNTW